MYVPIVLMVKNKKRFENRALLLTGNIPRGVLLRTE